MSEQPPNQWEQQPSPSTPQLSQPQGAIYQPPAGTMYQPAATSYPAQTNPYLNSVADEPNLGRGILAGLASAVIGATGWAIITAIINFQIGWMAVGVGFLVGLAVQRFGKGTDPAFGFVGAAFSLLGCVGGNLLAVCIMASRELSLPLLDVLFRVSNPTVAGIVLKETFSPMDILFYAIAVYEGYRFSTRQHE